MHRFMFVVECDSQEEGERIMGLVQHYVQTLRQTKEAVQNVPQRTYPDVKKCTFCGSNFLNMNGSFLQCATCGQLLVIV